jgi:hypothetical protein
MIEGLLQKNLLFKYNNWFERRELVCSDEARYFRAVSFSNKKYLSPSEKAAFYLHELTGCEGMEFVAFSNIRIRNPVTPSKGVILVPCFLNGTESEGRSIEDPLLLATMEMERNGRYVYDGWIPITTWDKENVGKAIRNIDEALSLFCLSGRFIFEWEPKYPQNSESPWSYCLSDNDIVFKELEKLSEILGSLKEADQIAVYRSLAWMSQSFRLSEPAARFLFLILSIESFATYIEEKAADDSPFFALKTDTQTKEEKRKTRERCIDEILNKYPSNKIEAIEKAHSKCMGIGRQLEGHLKSILGQDANLIDLFFNKDATGVSLYGLRHTIAHGSIDALDETQRDLIGRRINDAEKIAHRYISTVLKKGLHFEISDKIYEASLSICPNEMVASSEGMHRGPTHMAIIYSRVP